MNPRHLGIVCFRAEAVPNPNLGVVCFRVETVPNPNLMAQCNLLLTPRRAFPVQPTANAK